jgi:hypothetical protein
VDQPHGKKLRRCVQPGILATMKLHRYKNDYMGHYYVEIGWRMFGSEIRHQRLRLPAKGEVARQRAEKLWELWTTKTACGRRRG